MVGRGRTPRTGDIVDPGTFVLESLALQRDLLQDDIEMSTLKSDLARARAAYARCSWLEAYDAFARAEEPEPLAPADLELRATTARMLARDDEAVEILERAHHAYLERGRRSAPRTARAGSA